MPYFHAPMQIDIDLLYMLERRASSRNNNSTSIFLHFLCGCESCYSKLQNHRMNHHFIFLCSTHDNKIINHKKPADWKVMKISKAQISSVACIIVASEALPLGRSIISLGHNHFARILNGGSAVFENKLIPAG